MGVSQAVAEVLPRTGDQFMPCQTQKLITFILDTCKIIDPGLLNITPIKWFSFEINHIYLSLFNSQLESVIQNFQVVYLHIYQFQLAAWKDLCPKIIKCARSCLFKSQTWAYLSTKTTISSSRTQMIMQTCQMLITVLKKKNPKLQGFVLFYQLQKKCSNLKLDLIPFT